MAAVSLWSDDPAERRRRLEESLARHRAWELEERDWVTYLPASSWYVDPRIHKAAEWAAEAAARELGLPFTPEVRWFRQGTATDRLSDHPLAFRDKPNVGGFVIDGEPQTIWLSTRFCEPGATVAPSLQHTVAHETAHVAQQLQGLRGRTQARERLAELVAGCLERGEPVP